MRIRKRAVPLPLSLLSPVPFSSDPHHLHLVQLPSSPPLSDSPDLRSHRLIPHDSPTVAASTPQPPPLKACEDAKMNDEQKEEINNTSKQSDSGAVEDNGVPMVVSLPLCHSSNQATGRWCDGDKAIPLKKRKASFEMNGMFVITREYSKMKSKTNKNCPLDEDDDDVDYEEDDNSDSENDSSKRKRKRKGKKSSSMGAKTKTKKKRGGSLMEGSRCSRVNGRGWRCMQPTLVGYSLCEHHLGKGRLRSMSSVRARSTKIITSTTLLSQLPPDHDQEKSCNIAETPKQEESMIHDYDDDNDDDDDDGDDEKRPICAGNGRKRTRIGMVKARSLSSLLCLPNSPTTTTSVVQIGATSANKAT